VVLEVDYSHPLKCMDQLFVISSLP
jgi:hypothetical protein